MKLSRLLWKVDARGWDVVWTYGPRAVTCYVLGREHVRGRGRNGVQALASLLTRLP